MHLHRNSQLRSGVYFNGFLHRFLYVYTAAEKYAPILISSIKCIVHKQDIASLGIFQESNNQEKFQRGIAIDFAIDTHKGDTVLLHVFFFACNVRLLNGGCGIFINKSQQWDRLRWCD